MRFGWSRMLEVKISEEQQARVITRYLGVVLAVGMGD